MGRTGRSGRCWVVIALSVTAASAPNVAMSRPSPDFEAIRKADLRVAKVGERLAMANVALCHDTRNRTGLILHDIAQYAPEFRDAAVRSYGFERPIAVEAVVPGSPADRAGIVQNAGLIAFDDEPVTSKEGTDGPFARMSRIFDREEALSADGVLLVTLVKDGQIDRVRIATEKGCRSRFQIALEGALNASADGTYVQIDGRMVDYAVNDEELAALLAHELAHNILNHPQRLTDAGVSRGIGGWFGRSAGLIRATETEADRLSLYLMANAGFDPQVAIVLWDRLSARTDLGFLSSPTHPGRKRRVAQLREELLALGRLRAQSSPDQPMEPVFPKLQAPSP